MSEPARRRWPIAKPGGDDGNIIVALMVMVVTTTLIVALMNTTLSGLHNSRRAGGSANALQAADAGINDAAKAITDHTCSSPPCQFTGGSSIGAGSYTYTATWISNEEWQVVSVGTDTATKSTPPIQRKVVADAVARPLFNNAFFAIAGATIKGTADSYTGPTNTCDSSSNASGTIGSDGGISLTQSAGSSSYNCRQFVNGYNYAADGCTFYGQSSLPAGATGPGACPPAPYSNATPQPFQPPPVKAPTASTGDFTCSNPGQIGQGQPAGSIVTYVYNNITLSNGCSVAAGVTAILYALSNVTIGTATGNCNNFVNPPPGAACQSSSGNAVPVWPSNWYATGWSGNLEINVQGSGTVSFANHTDFWGVIDAPNSTVSATGGSPQVTVFGSIVAHSANESTAQFAFHYDESLQQIYTTGEFQAQNWHEVSLSATW